MDPKAFSRMLSFCHDYENATADNLNRIGCFGVGFKVCVVVLYLETGDLCGTMDSVFALSNVLRFCVILTHWCSYFKAGSMRIGDDVLVLTKKDERLSMGLLSTSLNKGKDVRCLLP